MLPVRLDCGLGPLRRRPGGTAPLPDCDPTCPKARSLRPFGPFFANVISGWTVATDQSGGVQSSDLQVAKYSSGFAMAHKMGLVKVSMSAHNVYDNLVYDGNSFNSVSKTWTVSSYGTYTEWNGSTTFTSSDKPLVSGTNCYQIVKPNVTTPSYATSTVESSHKYAWNQDCVAITTAGQYDAYNIDYDVDFIAATFDGYSAKLYCDGQLKKESSKLSSKFPITYGNTVLALGA